MENELRVGMAMGTLVAVVFGLVFIEVNSGELPGSWPLVVRVAGAVVAAVLLAGVVWVARKGAVRGEVRAGGPAAHDEGVTRTGIEPVSPT